MTPKQCRITFNRNLRFHFKQCQELGGEWAEFAGYTVQEYLVRVSYTDGSPFRYGVLIDVEDGERRRDPEHLAKQPDGEDDYVMLGQISEQETEEDKDTLSRFEERFRVFGEPFHLPGFVAGPPWTNMLLVQIPTSNIASDEDIVAEQEQIIKDYIKDMRDRWKKHLDEVDKLGEGFKAEFTEQHYPLAAPGAEPRWEVLRAFAHRRLGNQPTFYHLAFLTLVEWICLRRGALPRREDYLSIVNQLRMPLQAGHVFHIEVDLALPYVATYRSEMSPRLAPTGIGELTVAYRLESDGGQDTESSPGAGPPEEFMPFHNFGKLLANHSMIVVPSAARSGNSIGISCTGYAPFAVLLHIITQIEFLWAKNFESMKPYQAYIQRLGMIRDLLRGMPMLAEGQDEYPIPLGPFCDWSDERFEAELDRANKPDNPMRQDWEQADEVDVVKGNPAHLLMGMWDIDRLSELFRSVIDHESTPKGGRCGKRNVWIAKYQKWLADFYLQRVMDALHRDLWWQNQDQFFGTALYDQMVLSVLSFSNEADRVYQNRLKPRLYNHPDLSKPQEDYRQWVQRQSMQTLSDPASWYLVADYALTEVYQLYLDRHVNALEAIRDAHKATVGVPRDVLKEIYKVLRRYREGMTIDRLGKNLERRLRELCGTVDDLVETNPLDLYYKTRDIFKDEIDQFAKVGRHQKTAVFNRTAIGVSSLAAIYSLYVMADAFEGDSAQAWANLGANALNVTEITASVSQEILRSSEAAVGSSALGRLTQRKTVQFLADFSKWISMASGAAGIAMGVWGAVDSFRRDDTGTAIAETVGTGATAIYTGALWASAFKVKTATLLCTGPVGWILLAIGVGAAILSVWQPWKTKAEEYCKDFLLEQSLDQGGMDWFKHFKDELMYEHGGSDWYVRYDKKEFGSPKEVKKLLDRVEDFITDDDTFDDYE